MNEHNDNNRLYKHGNAGRGGGTATDPRTRTGLRTTIDLPHVSSRVIKRLYGAHRVAVKFKPTKRYNLYTEDTLTSATRDFSGSYSLYE